MTDDDLEGIKAILSLHGKSTNVIGEIWMAPYRCPCCTKFVDVVKVHSPTKTLRYGQCPGGSVMIRAYRNIRHDELPEVWRP